MICDSVVVESMDCKDFSLLILGVIHIWMQQEGDFGSSYSWMTCMDECLTEYYLRVTYVDFYKRISVSGGEGHLS